jgi:ArsR family transcriptional regulator
VGYLGFVRPRFLFQHPLKYLLTAARHFSIHRNMKKSDAVTALAALAQDNRLDVFRLLVQAGPEGMPAGKVAEELGLAPNTLTFHFDRLRDAGLVAVRREGRSMIYAAQFDVMNTLLGFLTENCCQGAAEKCAPAVCQPAKPKRSKVTA